MNLVHLGPGQLTEISDFRVEKPITHGSQKSAKHFSLIKDWRVTWCSNVQQHMRQYM